MRERNCVSFNESGTTATTHRSPTRGAQTNEKALLTGVRRALSVSTRRQAPRKGRGELLVAHLDAAVSRERHRRGDGAGILETGIARSEEVLHIVGLEVRAVDTVLRMSSEASVRNSPALHV